MAVLRSCNGWKSIVVQMQQIRGEWSYSSNRKLDKAVTQRKI